MTERELIRKLRRKIEGRGCHCHLYRNQLCGDCELLGLIDAGLAEIRLSNPGAVVQFLNYKRG